MAKKLKETWHDFLLKRERQDLMLFDIIKGNIFNDSMFIYLLKQGLRESLIKSYLYKTIPSIDKIKDAQFSDDRVFIEEMYQKNQEAYDDKNISKEDAIKALQEVYLKKKKILIDTILLQEENKVYAELQKKYKTLENKELFNTITDHSFPHKFTETNIQKSIDSQTKTTK